MDPPRQTDRQTDRQPQPEASESQPLYLHTTGTTLSRGCTTRAAVYHTTAVVPHYRGCTTHYRGCTTLCGAGRDLDPKQLFGSSIGWTLDGM